MKCDISTADYYDCEIAEFRTSIVRRARKEHRCCECKRVIAIGDSYERMNWFGSGQAWVYPTCLSCSQLLERIIDVFHPKWVNGDLKEMVSNAVNECEIGNWMLALCLCAQPPVLPHGEPFDWITYWEGKSNG